MLSGKSTPPWTLKDSHPFREGFTVTPPAGTEKPVHSQPVPRLTQGS